MTEEVKLDVISRRKALFLLGLGGALCLVDSAALAEEAPAGTETGAAAGTPGTGGTAGMQRRQQRRTHRHERRHQRRTGQPAGAAPAGATPAGTAPSQ